MIPTHRLEAVVGELVDELDHRFPYAAALIGGSSGTQIRDNGDEQNASESNPSRGIVFTIYDGASFSEYATSDLAPESLAKSVRAWADKLTVHRDGRPIIGGGVASPTGRDRRSFAVTMQINPAAVSLSEKLAMVRDLQRRSKALDSRIVQAQVQYTDAARDSVYLGRGRYLEQHIPRVTLAVLIAVSDGSRVRYHYISRGGTYGYDGASISEQQLREAVDIALRLLEAEKIQPGEYEIITDPGISGVLAHESLGHGVELDLFPKGRALSAKYLGRQVAVPELQMFDDPSIPGGHGSYFFDDEGELARPTQILRDGIFVRPISDFASATLTPGIHTPNGRRQDFTRKVYARMTNTYFGRGTLAPADMIASVEHGIYLRSAESGMEDPMGWGIQITAHYGEEIVNGQTTGRLFAPIGVTGYVPDVLCSISAIGSDFELWYGFCGKGHKEMVPVSTGGPHLRMKARLG
ncbi:MAG: TldD/PmbA family protein [Ktedonobacterales bacterium]